MAIGAPWPTPWPNSLRERWRRSERRERQVVGAVRRCSADVRRDVGVPHARRLPTAVAGGYGWSDPRSCEGRFPCQDNQMYDRLSHTWWEDDGFLNVLKSALNPSRVGYMRRILTEDLGHDPKRLRILDVGCGGGLLAEEFARLGCAVTGVDPSTDSLEVARAHAREGGLDIDYREATGDALPFADGEFPAAYCCDVLEHVDDVGRTLAEIARVLEPGGVFLYDTVNRTLRSKLLMIKLSQEWSATAWAEPDLHEFDMFIRPEELEAHL